MKKFLVVSIALAALIASQILLDSSLVFAQGVAAAGAPHQPGFMEVLSRMTPMFVLVFFIFYFMVMKPQQAKVKAHQDLIGGMKKGETVITSGGVIGRVAGIEKDYILLEIAQNVRVRVELAHVVKRQTSEVSGNDGASSDKISNAK